MADLQGLINYISNNQAKSNTSQGDTIKSLFNSFGNNPLNDRAAFGEIKRKIGKSQILNGIYDAINAPSDAYFGRDMGGMLVDDSGKYVESMRPFERAANLAGNVGVGGYATNFGKPVQYGELSTYIKSTPSKPDPRVGTRFERQDMGNLTPKVPMKIEDMQGGSIKIMPWDSTNAEQLITSVSDEPINTRTTGGQDFARALHNYNAGVGGASNREIAKRIASRVSQTRDENIAAGGNGNVYMLPSTMGAGAENFSTMPTDIYTQLIQRAPDKSAISQLNEFLRIAPVNTTKGIVRPFGNFKGIDTPEGILQLYTGEGFGAKGTAGEFRKAFAKEMSKTRNEQAFGYNSDDVIASLMDPSLVGVPRGYAGNTIIKADDSTRLMPSTHPSYDTDFSGKYSGSLMRSAPVEVLMPKSYARVYEEFANKYSGKRPEELRNMTIAALEKRKDNFSELVDQQVVDSYYNWLEGLSGR